jgi:hypothetical protein
MGKSLARINQADQLVVHSAILQILPMNGLDVLKIENKEGTSAIKIIA